MISDIRRQLQGPLFRSFMLIIVVGMLGGLIFSTIQYIRSSRAHIPWVLKINNQQIDLAEFNHELRQQQERMFAFERQYGMAFGAANIKQFAMQYTITQLTRQALVNQTVNELGFQVHPDIVGELIVNPRSIFQELVGIIPFEFLDRSGSFDCTRMKQYLQRAYLPIDFFEKKLENAVLARELDDIVSQAAYAPQYMIDAEYNKEYAPKKFTIYTIPIEHIKNEQAKKIVSNEAIEQFYSSRKRQYAVPEQRSGMRWVFDPATYGITVDDKEIETYYQNHKSTFIDKSAQVQIRDIFIPVSKDNMDSIRTQAEDILQKVVANPQQFSRLAQEYSHDEKSAKNGGLLPPFSRSDKTVPHAVIRAAFLLPEDNAISDLISVPEGFHIIQRVKKEQPTYKPHNVVAGQIKSELINKKFKELFSRDAKQLMEKMQEQSGVLKEFVAKKSGKSEPINSAGSNADKESGALFKLNKIGSISYNVNDDGKGVITQLTNIVDSYEPALDTIREKVVRDWHAEETKKSLDHIAKELSKAIEQKTAQDLLKKQFKVAIKQTQFISVDKPEQTDEFTRLGLPMQEIMHLTVPGSIVSKINDQGAFLVTLDAIQNASPEQIAKRGPEIRTSILKKQVDLLNAGFIASLYRNAKIEITERDMPRLQE